MPDTTTEASKPDAKDEPKKEKAVRLFSRVNGENRGDANLGVLEAGKEITHDASGHELTAKEKKELAEGSVLLELRD